ncbi:hypothetical protein SNE40_020147 [Patella caerulea]|uniref:Uncharacterized protein n=1 Tax=Patella caerulea TaxID=87958 RepID=A0AAN8GDU1_PATCE
MVSSFEAFKGHVERVSNQYCTMKNDLPVNHLIVHMDFAENYSCQIMEEIQSAFWTTKMVTLHPVVLHYCHSNGSVELKSIVFVSDVMQHNTSMVHAIITRLMGVINEVCPSASNVHFWTDSPTSQYRNKTIFDLISRFKTAFGLLASWHYFEVGHGKGACVGVGGTAKRNADMAVKLGTVVIQDAPDFFAWAVSEQNTVYF